jgi:hypothetical protein
MRIERGLCQSLNCATNVKLVLFRFPLISSSLNPAESRAEEEEDALFMTSPGNEKKGVRAHAFGLQSAI